MKRIPVSAFICALVLSSCSDAPYFFGAGAAASADKAMGAADGISVSDSIYDRYWSITRDYLSRSAPKELPYEDYYILDERVYVPAPEAVRDKAGYVRMTALKGDIYYTLNGKIPTEKSRKYTKPFRVTGPCHIAFIAISGENRSVVVEVNWDVAPAKFSVLTPTGADAAVDALSDVGDEEIMYGTVIPSHLPLIVELGTTLPLRGFFYEPLSGGRRGCLIEYNVYVSNNGKTWTKVAENAVFENIETNHIRYIHKFDKPIKTRFVWLEPVRCQNEAEYGVGEFGVLTDRKLLPLQTYSR